MSTATRRDFLTSIAAGAFVGSLQGALGDDASSDFRAVLLGDTHFDRREHHDFEWLARESAKDLPQIENYCRLTAEALPALLKTAAGIAHEQRAGCILHVGDFVEGLCGSRELADRHCREGVEFFQQAGFAQPLMLTKGNHDVTGPGAKEAFAEILLPFSTGALAVEATGACHAIERGPWLIAAFDAYDPQSIDWLEATVAGSACERLCVLTHMPVVSYNARAHWRVYDSERHLERRQRLLALLGLRRAIVLTGHLHKTCFLTRHTAEGPFVQVAVSSILSRAGGAASVERGGVEAYSPELLDLEPNFDPGSRERRRELLLSEQPHIRHFEFSDEAGFGLLRCDGPRVTLDLHLAASEVPNRSINLSELLDA